jgi:transcriptional regulator with XRE-family HTH domain
MSMTQVRFKKSFPKRLRYAREAQRLSQRELGKISGLSQDWISHIESGRRLPNSYHFWRLQKVLGAFV